MSMIYENDEEFDCVANLLLELEYAHEQRSQYEYEDEEYVWANLLIQELNIELELQRLR